MFACPISKRCIIVVLGGAAKSHPIDPFRVYFSVMNHQIIRVLLEIRYK